jgi:hypothetical protein
MFALAFAAAAFLSTCVDAQLITAAPMTTFTESSATTAVDAAATATTNSTLTAVAPPTATAFVDDRSAFVGTVNGTRPCDGESQWIWRVSKGTKVLFAVGTIHTERDNSVVESLLARFRQLRQRFMFTELDHTARGNFVGSVARSCAFLPSGTIYDVLTASTAARLRKVLAAFTARGWPTADLVSMRPLFLVSKLTSLPRSGTRMNCSTCGVDALFSRASCSGTDGLERLQDQCDMAVATGPAENLAWETGLILDALDAAEKVLNGTEVRDISHVFGCGSVDKFASLGPRFCRPGGELVRNRLLRDRDVRFAQALLCTVGEGDIVLGQRCSEVRAARSTLPGEAVAFAIGAAHLIRSETDPAETVLDHFVDHGFTVTRVKADDELGAAYECPEITPAPRRAPNPPSQWMPLYRQRRGLNEGEITGIVFGVLGFVALLAAIVAVVVWRKKRAAAGFRKHVDAAEPEA